MRNVTVTGARWLLGALALCYPAISMAQSPPAGSLTVDDAVRIALQQNRVYLQQVASVGIAEGSKREALARLLPGFSGSYAYAHDEGTNTVFDFPLVQELDPATGTIRTVETGKLDFDNQSDLGTWSGAARIDLSLPLWYGYKGASSDLSGARYSLEAASQDLAFQVRQRYYLVLRAQDLVTVQTEDLRLAQDEEERITSMFELGSVARADVLKAKVRVSEAELALIQQINATAIELTRMATLLGYSADTRLVLDGTLDPTPITVDSTQAAQEAVGRPDLVASRQSLETAGSMAKAASWSWFPALFASFDIRTTSGSSESDQVRNSVNEQGQLVNFPSPEDSDVGRDGWSVRVGASVNLDAFLNTGSMKRTKAEKRRREYQLEDLELGVQQELEEAILNYRASIASIASADNAVASAEEDVRLSTERYQQGLGTVLELLEAQVALTRARNTHVNALTGLKISEAALDKARGAPLPQ